MRTETLGACPLCGACDRSILHADVEGFTLWDCAGCRVAYLDPRPLEADIGEAYRGYHTHVMPEDAFAIPGSALGRFRRAARNAYVNARYGYHVAPASKLGGALLAAIPAQRFAIDHWIHRLPARVGGKVLDVGCGNGGWLAQMRQLGWQTVGVDFDPEAVAIARANGLDVRLGGIEQVAGERFDAIALSHVIEHVYHPAALLRSCADALSDDGQLWIATPNLDAFGHRLYGAKWRGIEAPRHLALFRAAPLERLLADVGLLYKGPLRTRPWAREHFPKHHRVRAACADLAGLFLPHHQEELAYTARKTSWR